MASHAFYVPSRPTLMTYLIHTAQIIRTWKTLQNITKYCADCNKDSICIGIVHAFWGKKRKKKDATREIMKIQLCTVFCRCKYYSKCKQKETSPYLKSQCLQLSHRKKKKRKRILCSSGVTGSHTGASKHCVSSFLYGCRVLSLHFLINWDGTTALTSIT